MDRIKRLSNSFTNLNKAEDRRRLKAMERIWIQDTPKIHALNYWWYRYFTNEFELYILDAIQFVETDVEAPK
jgi:hypothetical protein